MLVTLELDPASWRTIRRHRRLAAEAGDVLAEMLITMARVGADQVNEAGLSARLGYAPRHGAQGLAGSTDAWWLDRGMPLAAIGVPANSPAAAYAAILERGGTIRPRRGRALAIPVSPEAERYASPRDQPDLFLLRRPGKRPLLCEQVGRRLVVHWVLVSQVTIEARHWLRRGVAEAADEMARSGQSVLDEYVRRWSRD